MQAKKKKNLNYGKNYDGDNEASKIVKILLGVVLFLGLFYFLAMVMTGEIQFGNKKKDKEEVLIQYDEILAGQTFNRSEEEYYVLYYNFSDKIGSTYLAYKDNYSGQYDSPIYLVNLEDGLNIGYVADDMTEIEEYPENTDNLKVSNPTILKIKEHKVVERITGKDDVKSYLKELNTNKDA